MPRNRTTPEHAPHGDAKHFELTPDGGAYLPVPGDFSQVSEPGLVAIALGIEYNAACTLLDRCGSLRNLGARDPVEFAQVDGIGKAKAAALAAALEIGRRAQTADLERQSFVSSTDVARYFMPRLRDLRKEIFLVLMLDARNCLIRGVTVSVGSLTASIVHPREVFKPAILDSAASVIFVHNHPSGDPTPSQDDLKITTQLVDAGQVLDIKVLDHIIIGRKSFTSLAGKGLI